MSYRRPLEHQEGDQVELAVEQQDEELGFGLRTTMELAS
jgi:hypothetical protein